MDEIEILMMDGCTKSEAENHLKNGSVVFEDFEEHFLSYMKDLDIDEEYIPEFKKMIAEKKPARDWGIVEADGKTYYIMYCL
ncbi:MAG: hypothetical protein ACI3ZQ_05870 [Candidatus Cryptobacteroides sp.]